MVAIITILLESFIILHGVYGQDISFASFLDTIGRKYSCPGEIVTYVCSGIGNEIDIFAPPYINNTARLTFSRTDLIGTGSGTGAIGAFLFSAEGGSISVGVVVRDSDLDECIITCEVHSGTTENTSVTHRPSAFPSNVTSPTIKSAGTLSDPDYSAVNVSWSANPGNYDLKHYTVTVYSSEDEVEVVSVNITSKHDTVFVVLPVPRNILVHAKIMTMSMCDQRDDGVPTNAIKSANSSLMLQCGFLWLLSAAIAAVAVIM